MQALDKRLDRRDERFRRRSQLRAVTTLSRVTFCGHGLGVNSTSVPLKIRDGVAHFSGLQSCASAWACPVCGPKIRQHRADEIDSALKVATAAGMGTLFLTLTCRHDAAMRLLDLRKSQERAWKRLITSRPWRRLVQELGLGFVQQREVTYGEANGWHPHRHLALVLDRVLDDDEVESVRAALWPAWRRALGREGLSALEQWGLDLRAGDEAMGDYMLKVRGTDKDLAMEMMRGDLKHGRLGRRTPEQLLTGYLDDGDERDLDLWREYEQATSGWRMTTWSTGLREKLEQPEEEASDDQVVELEVGGDLLCTLGPTAWRAVRQASPGGRALLRAAEGGYWRTYLLKIVGGTGWWEPDEAPQGASSVCQRSP